VSTSTKSPRALLLMAALAIAVLAVGLANPGTANAWLTPGPKYQYPASGGTWQYGFWNAKVRSYYTVNKYHGSTVQLNGGSPSRSQCTRPGYKSIADIGAFNGPNQDDAYFYRLC
jgi:hypothetical protein